AVITDSHFQLPGATEQSAYASDARHNARNRFVVETINRSSAVFVVHGGDVPHPVPGLSSHRAALAVASETYAHLKVPLHVVPGNHDVGDKPNAWEVASAADADRHAVFSEYWGAAWRRFSHAGCSFVLIDTPIINSGSSLETDQWHWLEDTLGQANRRGERIFVFVHYPPFLTTIDEAEHYDNIAEPGRSALLKLLEIHRVEAVFCGHVHHFFYNRHNEIPVYILPATSFVRPEYSELCRVGPGDEFGRNDAGKLGFFFVHVDTHGHRIEPVRTHGAEAYDAPSHALLTPGRYAVPPSALIANLSNDLAELHDIPCGNLDAFRRKAARNDLPLQALIELGISTIRLPAGDFTTETRVARLRDIAALGFRFAAFSGGAEIDIHLPGILANTDIIAHWELVTSDGSVSS
ncbi:MAG: serine/threonine protein phosphatase, partial [bacterium]|nr:serine/threonine protein phosphatase [bacterium]